jgi:hypothetical protein
VAPIVGAAIAGWIYPALFNEAVTDEPQQVRQPVSRSAIASIRNEADNRAIELILLITFPNDDAINIARSLVARRAYDNYRDV